MESRLGRNLHVRRFGTRVAVAAIGLTSLLYPGNANAQEFSVAETYTQCGGATLPSDHTVLVERLITPNGQMFREYDMRESKECGGLLAETSSIAFSLVERSEISRPDVSSDFGIPLGCYPWSAGFRIERTKGVPGLDLEPESGDIPDGQQPNIRAKIHTDLVEDGEFELSGQPFCLTPNGTEVPAKHQINFAVRIEP